MIEEVRSRFFTVLLDYALTSAWPVMTPDASGFTLLPVSSTAPCIAKLPLDCVKFDAIGYDVKWAQTSDEEIILFGSFSEIRRIIGDRWVNLNAGDTKYYAEIRLAEERG